MTSMALTARSTDRLSSMKEVRKGVFDPVADEFGPDTRVKDIREHILNTFQKVRIVLS